jgi:hypothetical protein
LIGGVIENYDIAQLKRINLFDGQPRLPEINRAIDGELVIDCLPRRERSSGAIALERRSADLDQGAL